MGETAEILEEKMRQKKKEEEEMWDEYVEQRKKQRAKEEDELRRLKERQSKRRAQRAEQDMKLMEMRHRQEAVRMEEMETKKAREAEAKRKRLEEAERKRQAMQAMKDKQAAEPVKPNFVINKISGEDMGLGSVLGGSGFDKFANVMHARGEMGKTKEQLEEDKKVVLSFRVKPLEIEGLTVDQLKQKAKELWERYVTLESEKYDLETRKSRQDYDLKELAERQRQINRSRALKKGLDPEALTGKFPPKIQVASKYERRVDRRTYGDKKDLFSGGFEMIQDADCEKQWEEKFNAFKDNTGRGLPTWDPENPKNKQVIAHRPLLDDIDDEDIEPPVFQPPKPVEPERKPSPPKAASPEKPPPKKQEEEEEEEESEEEESEEEEEEEEEEE